MTDFNGPDPSTLSWGCTEAVHVEDMYWDGDELIPSSFEITAYTRVREGHQYPDPHLQVRCRVNAIGDKRWCQVAVAQGVTCGLGHPNPALFHYNRAAIEDAYMQASGLTLPEDIRLSQFGEQWIQIGTLAAA